MNGTCAPDTPSGNGNTTAEPLFVAHYAGDYHLAAGSPCIHAGHNAWAPANVTPLDVDGHQRIWNGTVDMVAYEYDSGPIQSYQSIVFAPIPDQVTTGVLHLLATASSGLPVSFAVAFGPGMLAGGNRLSFTETVTVTVMASQAGNALWNTAPAVPRSVRVHAAPSPIAGLRTSDFNRDGLADPAVRRTDGSVWRVRLSGSGYAAVDVPLGL